ncbi:MAG: hypothetical protein ABI678_27435 [Kofleriaceae bacterium]
MHADLVCPVCFHALGLVELDAANVSPPCGGCGAQLRLGRAVIPVPPLVVPARQLALRAPRPARSKMRLRRSGYRVIARQSFIPIIGWWSKRIIVDPSGYSVVTRKGRGTTAPLDQIAGFVLFQYLSSPPEQSPANLMWCSHAALSSNEGEIAFHPLFAHFKRDDGEYFISVMNAHLAALRG